MTALLMVPLAMFGGPALARTASALHQYGQPGSAQYQYKVALCHHTGSKHHPWHLIKISNRAVAAHLRHGDRLPPCATTEKTKHHGKPASFASPTAASHGDDDHGKSNGSHGKGHHGKS